MRAFRTAADDGAIDPTSGQTCDPRRDSGASLVEFAMVLPLLLALLFGMMEFSWAFAQINDLRYGTREGARAAAVDIGDYSTVGQAVCDRMDIVAPTQNVNVILTPDDPSVEGSVGALAQITVTADLQTITGFYDFLLASKTLSSTVEFRLEQPSGGDGNTAWWDDAIGGTTTFSCP
ncbi:MAG: TadE/TadG family type IV pilus assembly protein [Acidimicrobiia bacterium]|nr:TadE/TadG family type IV pilus assembly protein [Acidimicrobiia bacterium]MDX2465675.1 TadE/TadG family type IV pilus assembly protein [Acidimicrobiia bacterium]